MWTIIWATSHWQRYGFRLHSGAVHPPSAGNNIPSYSSEATLHSWSYYFMFKDALFVINRKKSAGDSEMQSTMISKLQLQPFWIQMSFKKIEVRADLNSEQSVSGLKHSCIIWQHVWSILPNLFIFIHGDCLPWQRLCDNGFHYNAPNSLAKEQQSV